MTLERSKSVYDFAVSRVARLYPAYWVAVALTSIVAYAAFPRWDSAPPSFGVVLVNLTMLQRFFMVGEIDKSYWTLAIELSFYVAIAAAFKARLMSRIEVPCII
jgi:peptidoglycan/LPS O-acetylase OafA/YrhL